MAEVIVAGRITKRNGRVVESVTRSLRWENPCISWGFDYSAKDWGKRND